MSVEANLMGSYLDIMVDACRRKQYERVEMLLPGAIYDAEFHETLDSKLVSILRELFDYYLSIERDERASEALQLLLSLSDSLDSSGADGAAASHLDLSLERLALRQLQSGNRLSLSLRVGSFIERLKESASGWLAVARAGLFAEKRFCPIEAGGAELPDQVRIFYS